MRKWVIELVQKAKTQNKKHKIDQGKKEEESRENSRGLRNRCVLVLGQYIN